MKYWLTPTVLLSLFMASWGGIRPHSTTAHPIPEPTLEYPGIELPPLGTFPPYLPPVPPRTLEIPAQFQGITIRQATVPNQRKIIALTFDDGPWGDSARILDILQDYRVKATFFVLGRNVQQYPELTRRMAEEGHALGNHTWNHHYHNMSATTAAAEIENTAARIFQETGITTTLFRPPGGFLNNGVAAYAKTKDYVVVMWSIDTKDYARPNAHLLAQRVLGQAHPGAIVLMHDGGGNRSRTVEALPMIIRGLQEKGYEMVTVPEMLAIQAGQLE
ncbi:polysaccharide deacetylase family protein [Lusitaniella coriacea LEGE 07157]|uniref:Polysaccharide deacetylase family protein n=1 Tax=Lusitaniella coriacea LEGE 07157 TaxID=945747 RepID=A0A8J7J7C5_9CYAN|nr:polysaccharide deacetylase family protein [Lusitaniella coriacea]MBE9115825.1 polysaccharide deacetylase family protein [Lusitaniella coriacea LEGE 07157]